jgi:hypothetical protein
LLRDPHTLALQILDEPIAGRERNGDAAERSISVRHGTVFLAGVPGKRPLAVETNESEKTRSESLIETTGTAPREISRAKTSGAKQLLYQ